MTAQRRIDGPVDDASRPMGLGGVCRSLSRGPGLLRRRIARFILWIIATESMLVPRIYGPKSRLEVGQNVVLNDALLNTASGTITIGDHSFFGHGVRVLAATHDTGQTGADRQRTIPQDGRDVRLGTGVWVGTGAIVLGPCVIGDGAVIAAGAVVTGEVPSCAIVGGVPARFIRWAVERSDAR